VPPSSSAPLGIANDLNFLTVDQRADLERRTSGAPARNLAGPDLDRVVELRASLGIPSDLSFVRSLNADPLAYGGVVSSGTDFFGLTVLPDEIPALIFRSYVQSILDEVNVRIAQLALPHVESRISTAAERGTVHVDLMFERALATAESFDVVALFPELVRPLVEIRVPPRSIEELEEIETGVRTANLERDPPVLSIDVDRWNGRIVAEVASEADAARLSSRLGAEVLDVRVGAGPRPTASKGQLQPYGLVHGALAIDRPIPGSPFVGICTSGFAVQGAYGSFLLTAGHCGSLNEGWTQGGQPTGPMAARNYPVYFCCHDNRFDAGAISTSTVGRPQWGRFHQNTNDWSKRIYGWIQQDADSIGNFYCHSGRTTAGLSGYGGPVCGALLSRSFAPTGYMWNPQQFRLIDTWSQNGDSGGAVYWDTIFGSLAVGLVSGAATSGNDAILSRLPYVTNSWGLTVMTN